MEISIPNPSLRNDRRLYALTDLGRFTAAQTHSASLRRVLLAVHHATDHGWAEEDDVWRDAFTRFGSRAAVRFRMGRYVTAGLLACRPFPRAGVTPVVYLSTRGADLLTRQTGRRSLPPLTRAPRTDQVLHHLLTVQAALAVLALGERRFVRFQGDEDLRSESRLGRQTRAGDDDKIPDGRLHYEDPRVGSTSVDIEILTSKYTDDVIRRKYAELPEGTLFFAPTERLARRTEVLVGRRPMLLP